MGYNTLLRKLYLQNASVHEAGHCVILSLIENKFKSVQVNQDGSGFVDGVEVKLKGSIDNVFKFVSYHLGGWAAMEIYYNCSIDFLNSPDLGFENDIRDIKQTLGLFIDSKADIEATIEIVQPITKKILEAHFTEFKTIAMKLLEKRFLTFDEVQAIMFPLKQLAARQN